MHEKTLMDAGLTQNEAKVYLALLQTGKSQSGRIVQKAGISSGKIYETLYRLIEKGLVEVSIDSGIKQFSAADPESILIYMKERAFKIEQQTKSLAKLVPELQKIKEFEAPTENVYLIKGFRGIRPLVYNLLQEMKGEAKIMGVRSSKERKFNIFWQHWHRERVKQKKKARALFSDKGTTYWDFFKKLRFTKMRYVSETSPSAIMVIDNHSLIFSYDKEFLCIHIVSSSIAKSFSSFFEGLWSKGKK